MEQTPSCKAALRKDIGVVQIDAMMTTTQPQCQMGLVGVCVTADGSVLFIPGIAEEQAPEG